MSENIPPPFTPPKKPSTKALGKRPMTEAQLVSHYAKQPKLADDSDDEDFKRMHGVPVIPPDIHPHVPTIVLNATPLVHTNQTLNNTVDITEGVLDADDLNSIYGDGINDAATDLPDDDIEEYELFGEGADIDDVVHEIDVAVSMDPDDAYDSNTAGMDAEELQAYNIAKQQLVNMLGLTEGEAREELGKRDDISGGRAW